MHRLAPRQRGTMNTSEQLRATAGRRGRLAAGAGRWILGLWGLAALAACRGPAERQPMTSEPLDPREAAALAADATADSAAQPPPEAVSPSAAATGEAGEGLADAASPSGLAATATPVQLHQEITVSTTPPQEADAALLNGYERRDRRVEVNTDRNAVEFPRSLTDARLSYPANPADQGAGRARALQLALRLPDQTSEFATCSGKSACGCNGITPYAYISLSHPLPPGTDLSAWRDLSLWVRSAEPFDLHLVLSCFVEPRPLRTDAPFDGYLDAAHTEMNPCWHAPRVELPLRAPIAVLGDDQWHRYQVRVDDLPASPPVELSGGGQMICTLAKVTHVVYVLKKGHPRLPGDYPRDSGVVRFDDLQALRPRPTSP